MKIRSFRHGSRSTSKGKIVAACNCGGYVKIVMTDHYNFESICSRCGKMIEEHRFPGGLSLFDWDKGRR